MALAIADTQCMKFTSMMLCVGLGCTAAMPSWADDNPASAPQAPAADKFEGAVGLVLAYQPTFSGSAEFKVKPQLAGFLRYGRFTVTGAGGFTTRRQDEVERGLDAELLRRERVRVNLSLRFDGGRQQGDSDQLRGLGDIRKTVRARLGARWDVAPRWQLSASTNVDVLNRGGGVVSGAGLGYTLPLDARQRLGIGLGVSGASRSYFQSWYGITPEQSLASGYPVYSPRAGLRDVGVSATWRIEIDPQWAAFAGGSTSYLLGPAAESPLTKQRTGWALSAGVARRF